MERGERDQQRPSRRDSNSGRCERSCAICRRTNHEAVGTDMLQQSFEKSLAYIKAGCVDKYKGGSK